MHPTHPVAPITFSFVLRFWLEHREIEGAVPVWRGVIELVPSGERQYFEGVNQLPGILARYLVNNDLKIKTPSQVSPSTVIIPVSKDSLPE